MAWAPDYLTSAELKAFARITDAADDNEVASAIAAASRSIDGFCSGTPRRTIGRQFGKVDTSEARRYSARWDPKRGRWVVDIDDLHSAAGIAAAVAAGTVDQFELQPVNALFYGRVYERLVVKPTSANKPTGQEEDEVTITTDKWGWSAFPAAVKTAAKLQSSRFLARRGSPYGIAGSPEQGSELRLLARVDPDVGVILTGAGLVKPPEIAFA